MRLNIIKVLAIILFLLFGVWCARAEVQVPPREFPAMFKVRMMATACDINRRLIALNAEYGEGNVAVFNPQINNFVIVPPTKEILEILRSVGECQELVEEFGEKI